MPLKPLEKSRAEKPETVIVDIGPDGYERPPFDYDEPLRPPRDRPTPSGDLQEHDFPAEDDAVRKEKEQKRERRKKDETDSEGNKSNRKPFRINAPQGFKDLIARKRLVGAVKRYRTKTVH